MKRSVAILIAMMLVGLAMTAMTWGLTYRLTPPDHRRRTFGWLAGWSFRGILVPVALWALMNVGLAWQLQPFMPQIQASRGNGGDWYLPFCRFLGFGIFIITTYWTAVTLAWVLWRASAGLRGETRSNFKALCLTCGLALLPVAAFIQWFGGWDTLGLAGVVVLAPMAGFAPAVVRVVKPPPMYARAVARIKFGKYAEAEVEILRQLENCEDDFDGWLLLAELYASQFNDLSEAEQTILEICDHPKTTPSQLSLALHRLADWHLKETSNPDGARRALQIICDRLPGSHLARMAQLRLQQLPATVEEFREQRIARPIPMPALRDPLDDQHPAYRPEQNRAEAIRMANTCVERLKHDPNDVLLREKLARLLAERLDQPAQGLDQLTLLQNLPDQPDLKRAEWLALAAAWRLDLLQDPDTARKLLERLIREFPQCPQAFTAKRRLKALDLQEFRG